MTRIFTNTVNNSWYTFLRAHFRFSEEDEYIDRAKRRIVVVVVVSFELFETTVASVSIALLVLVYVKPGWW